MIVLLLKCILKKKSHTEISISTVYLIISRIIEFSTFKESGAELRKL
jgi:hypothetical protein